MEIELKTPQRQLDNHKRYRERNITRLREVNKLAERERYHNNPEYREYQLEKSRRQYAKKKALKLEEESKLVSSLHNILTVS